jgi:hypothetical protein
MTTRKMIIWLALAFLAGVAIGGLIGWAWHAPGSTTTWADIRTWVGFVVVVLGVPFAAYQVYLQRRTYVGEASRNVGRDDLLDRQRRELQAQELTREREQAAQINVSWTSFTNEQANSLGNIYNNSRRPIRDVACQLDLGNGDPLIRPEYSAWLRSKDKPDERSGSMFDKTHMRQGWRILGIRADNAIAFYFPGMEPTQYPDGRMLVRFKDDAGLHWELDHHMHLVKLDQRDW